VFSKIDQIKDEFQPQLFLQLKMPRTAAYFNHFFATIYQPSLIFGCSVGEVMESDGAKKLIKFRPIGYLESLLPALRLDGGY
jgi:hypothetical protein